MQKRNKKMTGTINETVTRKEAVEILNDDDDDKYYERRPENASNEPFVIEDEKEFFQWIK